MSGNATSFWDGEYDDEKCTGCGLTWASCPSILANCVDCTGKTVINGTVIDDEAMRRAVKDGNPEIAKWLQSLTNDFKGQNITGHPNIDKWMQNNAPTTKVD